MCACAPSTERIGLSKYASGLVLQKEAGATERGWFGVPSSLVKVNTAGILAVTCNNHGSLRMLQWGFMGLCMRLVVGSERSGLSETLHERA